MPMAVGAQTHSSELKRCTVCGSLRSQPGETYRIGYLLSAPSLYAVRMMRDSTCHRSILRALGHVTPVVCPLSCLVSWGSRVCPVLGIEV